MPGLTPELRWFVDVTTTFKRLLGLSGGDEHTSIISEWVGKFLDEYPMGETLNMSGKRLKKLVELFFLAKQARSTKE
jgi:hypothetical protein